MNIHILVLIIAIALFGVLAFKQMSALILAPLVTIFVILCSGLPILDSLKGLFMPAATDYITKYFLTFFVGALLVRFISIQVPQNLLQEPSQDFATANLLHQLSCVSQVSLLSVVSVVSLYSSLSTQSP